MPSSIAMPNINPKPGPGGPSVALIAGPTASGKSALAIALARAANGTVINADASQVYADLAILSARPSPEEMAQAPHRLFGHVDGAHACSATQWAADARTEIASSHAAGRLPILVGGTGLYLRTLLDGIAPIPDIDPQIREAVRTMAVNDAYAALSHEDPAAAARLNAADTTRVARALEVVRSTGKPITHWQASKTGGIGEAISLRPLILLPPRDWLTERCDRRFLAMLEQGAIAEVEALVARGLNPDLPAMRAIGVPEITAFLGGVISREAMIERGQRATRRYAKRQYTWFSNQPPADWAREDRCISDNQTNEIVIKLLN